MDAVKCIRKEGQPVDLHMIEVLHMLHKAGTDSRLVKGLVMDHGGRHPGMPKSLKKCHILTMNYDLEYQKSEVNSGFMYNSAEQREKMVAAERKWVDDRTEMVLALKRQVCKERDFRHPQPEGHRPARARYARSRGHPRAAPRQAP